MTDFQKLNIYEELTYTVGDDTFIDSTVNNEYSVAFEDNTETGYFYAIDRNNGMTILDALHIYDVASVVDKHITSNIKILWTENQLKAILSINDYYHAVFDFENKAGYCRNGFPESNNSWTKIKDRKLTDNLLADILSV